jgi:hypothetical protein
MLSIGQLERLKDGIDKKMLSPNEIEHLVKTAFDRKSAGWTRADVEKLNEIDKKVCWQLWHLVLAIGRRHRQPDYDRFDAYDMTAEEVIHLARLAANAMTAEEFLPLAPVIQKLRLDSRSMTLKDFEFLVLNGDLPSIPKEVPSAEQFC